MRTKIDNLIKAINREKKRKIEIEVQEGNEIPPNLLNISQKLDELYFQEKLVIYCNYLSYSGIVAKENLPYQITDFCLLKESLFYLNQNDFDNPTIKVFWRIKMLFEKILTKKCQYEEDKDLEDCIKAINQHKKQFQPLALDEIYSFLTNYTIRRLNQGYHSYIPIIISLYNQILFLKYTQIKRNREPLNANAFRNIVSLCILHQDPNFYNQLTPKCIDAVNQNAGFKSNLEWAKQFVEKFKDLLPKKHQDKYYRYCKSLIYFKEKQYLKAFKSIGNIKGLRGMYINLDLKLLYLQIIYEINNMANSRKIGKEIGVDFYDEIDKKINAFRGIIWREDNEDSKLAYQKKYFSEFLILFKKLYKFYCKYNFVMVGSKEEYFMAKKKLEKDTKDCIFSYKKWFKEKLENIAKNNPSPNN